MGYVLIWLFFGIFAALLASNKNRSVVGWFFIGFLFGPFGLLFAFFMKDGKDLEKEEQEAILKSKPTIELKDSYYYEIKPSSDKEEWQNIKKALFKNLNGAYKIKQNDADVTLYEVSKEVHIKLFKTLKDNKPVYAIESKNFGSIEFDDEFDVVTSELTNAIAKTVSDEPSNLDTTDKLIKLSEMLEKGLITDNEFQVQKAKVLA